MADKTEQNEIPPHMRTNNLSMLARILHRNLNEWEECRARMNRNYDLESVSLAHREAVRTASIYINVIEALMDQPIALDNDNQ